MPSACDRKNSFNGTDDSQGRATPEEPFTRTKEVNQSIRCHEAAPIDKRQRGNIAKQCAFSRTWLVEMMKTPQLTVRDGEVRAK